MGVPSLELPIEMFIIVVDCVFVAQLFLLSLSSPKGHKLGSHKLGSDLESCIILTSSISRDMVQASH